MKEVIKTLGKPTEFITYLNSKKINFTVRKTSSTSIVEWEDNKYLFVHHTDSFLVSKGEMILQRRLKKEVLKNTEDKVFEVEYESDYFDYDSHLNYMTETIGEIIELDNVIEMDITKAYYQVAKNYGFIGEEFYQETLELEKYIRLRLLGSIATKKDIEKNKNGYLYETSQTFDIKLRNIWFKVVKKVDNIMKEVAKAIQGNFVFYWVDGIYFSKNLDDKYMLDPCIQIISEIFKKNNLKYSITYLDKIVITNLDEYLGMEVYINKKLKSQFALPYRDVKKYVCFKEDLKL